jgi:flagellar hook-basal body complex protein FliE
MASINQLNGLSTADILKQKNNISSNTNTGNNNFGDILKQSLNEVNTLQEESEKAMTDIATGQVKDLHQAALAIDRAEISMKSMLEVRNKAISAYKELLRTQM